MLQVTRTPLSLPSFDPSTLLASRRGFEDPSPPVQAYPFDSLDACIVSSDGGGVQDLDLVAAEQDAELVLDKFWANGVWHFRYILADGSACSTWCATREQSLKTLSLLMGG